MSQKDLSEKDLVTLINDAIALHKKGEFEDALLHYELGLPELEIKNAGMASSLYGNAGALYMQTGQNLAAKAKFLKAVECSPSNSQAHYNLAIILTSKLGDHETALFHVEKALDLGYDEEKCFHLKANILQDMNREEEAVGLFISAEEKAREKHSSSVETNMKLDRRSFLWRVLHSKLDEIIGRENLVGGEKNIISMKCISERPLMFLVDALVSQSECEHIMNR